MGHSQEFREYIDRLRAEGYTVLPDVSGADPDLIDMNGRAVDTWRESYPYDTKVTHSDYEREKYALQVELLKFQYWTQDAGQRHIILFEGRDAAGKGGTIKRFTEHLNPRYARTVALPKPSPREAGQWYYQKYIRHFPTTGEMVLFDRSWYNRAGVERVMGFCSPDQYDQFMQQTPELERMIVNSGISLTKLWFSVSRMEQRTRFAIRQLDPVRQWKLSDMDIASLQRWDDYTAAKQAIFKNTDRDYAPWVTIKTNDKKRGRLNAMRYFLNQFDYEGKDTSVVFDPDPLIVRRGIEAMDD